MNYTYNTTSNKILKVDDASNETASFKDVAGNDYDYWLDGSLKKDANKDITQIDYNYLKLPKQITLTGGRWIKYEYDADGTKLKKTLSTGKVFDYEEDEIYEDGVLYQTAHDEGRIVDGIYEYNIKDHLGNTRISFRDKGGITEVTQVNHVGAWGEPLTSINSVNTPKINNFTLSTYEKENDFGIGVFDAYARVFDPIAPRYWQIDPKSEISRRWSPYNYVYNNPIKLIDPDGNTPNEYDVDVNNGTVNKVSDLGGNEVDFYHYQGGNLNGQTRILDLKTFTEQWMSSSRFMTGYEHRDNSVHYGTIFDEFDTGTGPEKSLMGDSHPMNRDIMRSSQFESAIESWRENGINKKYYFEGTFGVFGAFKAGGNMTAQMLGKAGFSFYPLGDKVVIMVTDSKSKTSWSLNPFAKDEENNVPRVNGKGGPESTTHQTYIWTMNLKDLLKLDN